MRKIILIIAILCMLVACTKKQPTVTIATKPMTEQFILGEMLKMLIEADTDIKVDLKKGIGGGTANIHPALLIGKFDMYPEYTGTAWSYVLKETSFPSDEELFKQLVKEYRYRYGLEWVGMYGFNNTYGLVIRKDLADKYGISTYSDLAPYAPELTFGGEYDFFEREDGYTALCNTYDLHFHRQVDLDIGLKYSAINSKQIDVMNIFTTDGQLSVSNVKVLYDDKHFYHAYYCGTVVRSSVLKEYPQLRAALMKMENIISEEEMARLNFEVEWNKRNEIDVAREFLQAKGYLK